MIKGQRVASGLQLSLVQTGSYLQVLSLRSLGSKGESVVLTAGAELSLWASS